MIDQKIKLITGSLLHDIGKVVYREGSGIQVIFHSVIL